jgi:glycerol uptake facilitator-like aquaporin
VKDKQMPSLEQLCLSNFLSTFFSIFLVDSVIANEVLPGTKGHSLGFFGVAFGAGAAFAIVQMMFPTSSHMNPAALLALLTIGKLNGTEFILMTLSEIAGAFLGGILMYLVYLPHYRTIPEEKHSSLTRTRDHLDVSALRISSYNTKSSASDSKSWKRMIQEAGYYLTLKPVTEAFKHILFGSKSTSKIGIVIENDLDLKPAIPLNRIHTTKDLQEHLHSTHSDPDIDQLYNAAIKADQAAKLQTFANRPAIHLPLHNFFVEFICTITLIVGILLISKVYSSYQGLKLLIACYIQVCILCLGGPTGFSGK